MAVPLLLTLALGVAGWFAGDAAGTVVGVGLGLLVTVMVAAGAAVWSRQIGALLEPEDARAVAPRPPGFGAVADWVYDRTIREGE
jgi:hypothetical protein